MKKMGLVVTAPNLMNDRIFFSEDNLQINNMYGSVWKYFKKRHVEFHTIDMYENISEIDYIILYNWDLKWFWKLFKQKKLNRTILIAAEPETFEKMHSPDRIKKLLSLFPIILTWNKEVIDNDRILPWMTIQMLEENETKSRKDFQERKLLCCIANNKTSEYGDELYSERKKVITYAEKERIEFDLFGNNWDRGGAARISLKGKCTAEEKKNIYGNYKFALALESTKNLNGFISEKIFDCFNAGIVPIYAGSKNIDEYVPQNCYIDYFKFNSVKDLIVYLNNMSEEEWEKYCQNGKDFLHSDAMIQFSPEAYCDKLEKAIEKLENNKYSISKKVLLVAETYYVHFRLKEGINKIKKLIKNIIFKTITE